MKLSKERRVYAAILGLAMGGLVVERVFFAGGPQSAAASVAPVVEATAPTPANPAPIPVPAGPTLSSRLEELRPVSPCPPSPGEAFRIPESWRPVPPPDEVRDPQDPQAVAARFAKSHRLTSVVLGSGGGRSAAFLDGGILVWLGDRIEDGLDGFTLVAVTRDTAVFEKNGTAVELQMKRPSRTDVAVSAGSEKDGPGSDRR